MTSQDQPKCHFGVKLLVLVVSDHDIQTVPFCYRFMKSRSIAAHKTKEVLTNNAILLIYGAL